MRIIDIVKTTLSTDKLKLDEELERVMNDKTTNTDDKVESIKLLIRAMVLNDMSFKKWESLFDDNKKEK